jgi:hypothetical protein
MTRLAQFCPALLIGASVAAVYACGSDEFDPSTTGKTDAGTDASGGSAGTSTGGAAGTSGGGSGGTGSSASGGTGGSAGEAGPACPSGHECVAPAPTGWSGPILRSTGACGGSWTQSELTLHDGLTAPPAQCSCACTPIVDCPNNVLWRSYNNFSCAGFLDEQPMLSCTTKTTLSHGVRMTAASPSCSAVVNETIPVISWTTDTELCGGGAEGGTCDGDDLCLPSDSGELCIYQPGDTTCPPEYPNETKAYTDVTDTRDCPATCGCTPAGSPTCTAPVFTYTGTQCTTSPTGQLTVTSGGASQCLGSTVMAATAGSITAATTGTCTGAAVTPAGSAVPSGVHTVCCAIP